VFCGQAIRRLVKVCCADAYDAQDALRKAWCVKQAVPSGRRQRGEFARSASPRDANRAGLRARLARAPSERLCRQRKIGQVSSP